MRNMARASNLIGGWLPVTALAQVAQLVRTQPGARLDAAHPRRHRAGGAAGRFRPGQQLRCATQYPTLTGKGLTVGILSDSFNCYNYYAANGLLEDSATATTAMPPTASRRRRG